MVRATSPGTISARAKISTETSQRAGTASPSLLRRKRATRWILRPLDHRGFGQIQEVRSVRLDPLDAFADRPGRADPVGDDRGRGILLQAGQFGGDRSAAGLVQGRIVLVGESIVLLTAPVRRVPHPAAGIRRQDELGWNRPGRPVRDAHGYLEPRLSVPRSVVGGLGHLLERDGGPCRLHHFLQKYRVLWHLLILLVGERDLEVAGNSGFAE